MRSRIVVILIVLGCLWTVMIARAAFLQLLPNGRLKSLERKQFETVVTLNARRGDVFDRNGHELAVSMASYSLFADPKIIEAPKRTAKELAEILRLPAKQIEEKLRAKKKRFVWIQRRMDKPTRDAVAELKARGLGFIEESDRVYPNDRLLAQVLGFVGGDAQGLEGLEMKYNDQLAGESRTLNLRRDARGRPLIVNGQAFDQAPDGRDVQLTVDRELQFVLEQELAASMRHHEADSAVGVVLDAQTSEVLAMASTPSFDPNRAMEFPSDRKRNRVVADAFEPGSTMKTFIIAGALSRGLLEPNTKFDCENGMMKIGKRTVREADSKHRWGLITASEILAYSSNVGAAKIGFKLGQEATVETLRSFGFGDRTGADLPGEAKGIVQALPWSDHLHANVSFGHGVSATALQIANAYAAIANGGWLRKPYIVKTIRDRETGEVIESKPQTVRRVLNEEHLAKMRLMLLAATTGEGTGVGARVPGYPVAGKTGTAQKVNPTGRGYLRGGYISSFAGFLPANDPRFVIYVALDHPKKEYYGSAVAAPLFQKIAKFAVRHSGLAPVLISEGDVVPQAARVAKGSGQNPIRRAIALPRPAHDAAVPDLTGLTLREVLARVGGSEIPVKIHGQGFVSRTIPAAGAKLSENRELNVFLVRDENH